MKGDPKTNKDHNQHTIYDNKGHEIFIHNKQKEYELMMIKEFGAKKYDY